MKHYEYTELLIVEPTKRSLIGMLIGGALRSYMVRNDGGDAFIYDKPDYNMFIAELNELGNSGWEVVNIVKTELRKSVFETRAFLKRPDEIYSVQEIEEEDKIWENRIRSID